MARQKRLKGMKARWPSFLGDIKDRAAKWIFEAVAASLVLAIFFFAFNIFILRSGYFQLRSVEVKDAFIDKSSGLSVSNEILQWYRGKNIFQIDIRQIARHIQGIHPDAKRLSVKRVLPDKLLIIFNFRKPVAVVSNSKSYPIDEDFFILLKIDPRYLKELPTISGINPRSALTKGGRIESKNLRLAVELLKEIRNSRLLSEYGVSTIEAGDLKNMAFYMKNGVEIRVGYENLSERLRVLARTLQDSRLVMDRIKYIDVRFESVTIGPKE